jgi:hypothetical protein
MTHCAPAAGAEERIHLIDLADEASPGAADLQGCPMVRAREWVRRSGFREEPVLPAVAPRPVRVPAIEERGLLVDIGDLGGHLRQEVQRVEHPEVRLVAMVNDIRAVEWPQTAELNQKSETWCNIQVLR